MRWWLHPNVAIMPKKKPPVELHPLEIKAEKALSRLWKVTKKEVKIVKKWLFFYQPENKMDAMFHIFDIFVIIYITLRLTKVG